MQSTRKLSDRNILCILDFAPDEACRSILVTGMRWALTPPFHPYPKAVYFLLRWLSARTFALAARSLTGIISEGVRTFLCNCLQRLSSVLCYYKQFNHRQNYQRRCHRYLHQPDQPNRPYLLHQKKRFQVRLFPDNIKFDCNRDNT